MQHVVEIQDLTKQYITCAGALQALRGVDLQVRTGEMLLLAGPSGCGKTTLISIIGGMLQATSGEVRVLGTRLADLAPVALADFRSTHVGMVFQELHLFPSLSAEENAALPLIIAGVDRSAACARAREVLGWLGLQERCRSLVRQLSGGQKQRVALARAVVHEPAVVVCDEPTSALDRATGDELMTVLRKVTVEQGRAAIVVTHDSRLFRFADRVAFMEDGRVDRVASCDGALQNDDEIDFSCSGGVVRNLHRACAGPAPILAAPDGPGIAAAHLPL